MPTNGIWAVRSARWSARVGVLALLVVIAVTLGAESGTEAHTGHPQKKLFNGHWYHADIPANIDLTTANFFYGTGFDYDGDGSVDNCDGGVNTASCMSKWSTPFQQAIDDWNAQPTDVTFVQTGNQSGSNDIFVIVTDLVLGYPGILGIGLLYDINGNWCGNLPGGYDSCTYYYGDAWQGDDGHAGVYGTTSVRRATVLHEIGHLINLRHEGVNADESVLYPCGFDNTGPIPASIMAYDCIDPPAIGGSGMSSVQDWDTCGVNHKYLDPVIAFSDCDSDNDGPVDQLDNCPTVYNPTQSNVDADGSGDACDADIDGDGILNGSDPEADGDTVLNTDETNCGSDPTDGSRRPERVDGVFLGVSDDGDAQVDEALPPGTGAYDCDGDGFIGNTEQYVFSAANTVNDQKKCGVNAWPVDINNDGFVDIIGDISTVTNHFGRSVPPAPARYNIAPDGFIDILGDISRMTGFFGRSCTP